MNASDTIPSVILNTVPNAVPDTNFVSQWNKNIIQNLHIAERIPHTVTPLERGFRTTALCNAVEVNMMQMAKDECNKMKMAIRARKKIDFKIYYIIMKDPENNEIMWEVPPPPPPSPLTAEEQAVQIFQSIRVPRSREEFDERVIELGQKLEMKLNCLILQDEKK